MLLSCLEASTMDEAWVVLRVDVLLLLQSFLDRLVEGKSSLHSGSVQELHSTLSSASQAGQLCLIVTQLELYIKLVLVFHIQDAVACKCALLA